MQRTVEKVFFALIRFEINGSELCEDLKNLITPEILPALFKLAKRHDLAHLIGDALDKNGLLPNGTEAKKRFLQERNMAVYRYEQLQYEFEQICGTLEKAKISFIPLKGSVIRQYYPETWMRTSCDIDILVREEDLEQAIKSLEEELKYTANTKRDYHDVSLFSESGVHLELHYSLCENMENIDALLLQVWDYVIPQTESCEKKLVDGYFLFHIVAHMLYHFQNGGCGVRPLLDLWLMRKNITEESQLTEMVAKCGIKTFYQTMVELSECWFGKRAFNEKTLSVQDYLLKAGVYGSKKNSDLAETVKSGSKKKQLMRYIFLPYKNMVILYPILRKVKILLSFFHVWRWITRIFRIKKAVKKTEQILTQEQEELEEIRVLFEMLNI